MPPATLPGPVVEGVNPPPPEWVASLGGIVVWLVLTAAVALFALIATDIYRERRRK